MSLAKNAARSTLSNVTRFLSTGAAPVKFTQVSLPELKWGFGELEPFISGKINELHYTKHHQTYVNGFNKAVEQQAEALATGNVKQAIALQQNVKFHGGGYLNHCLFWGNLTPQKNGGGELPSSSSALYKKIIDEYGSFDNLKKITNAKLAGVQGSGWAFVVKNTENNTVDVVQRYNQDIVSGNLVPLVAIDAWEHAYYLQYQNKKVDYFKAIWNVINWAEASKRFDEV